MIDVAKLSKEDFTARFVARMVAKAGETFPDGSSIVEYAVEIAGEYWDDPNDSEGPEECADTDISYWE